MLYFYDSTPKKPGDVVLGGEGTRYDLELVRDRNHGLFGADPEAGFALLGMMASHQVTEARLASGEIDAQPQDTLDIAKPVVDELGEVAGKDNAISFARGVFHAVKVDFPEFRELNHSQTRPLFQELISGVSEEAAVIVEKRATQA